MASNAPLIDVSLHVNDTQAHALFRDLSAALKTSVPLIIKRQTGTMGRYLAENTQPVAGLSTDTTNLQNIDGGSLHARDLGRGAVRRDLSKVYASPSNAFQVVRNKVAGVAGKDTKDLAKAFYALLMQGKIEEGRELLRKAGAAVSLDIKEWDDGKLHRDRRNPRGRVPKSFAPTAVGDKKAVRAYIKKIEARVGWAKAAWINAAKMIDSRGLSKVRGWIKKHNEAPGVGIDRTSENFPHVVLESNVPYADRALPGRQYERAFRQFEDAIIKEVEMILEARSKKAARAAA